MDDSRLFLTRRSLLSGIAAAAAASALSGCGVHPLPGWPEVSNPQPVPPGTVSQGKVTVGTTAVGTIPSAFLGLGYERYTLADPYFYSGNANLIALFNRLGPGVLQLSADESVWTPKGAGGKYLQVTPANVDALAGFLKATGWQCLYGINFVNSTPELAAAEVAYVVAALGPNLLGIEIGISPDTYGNPGSYFPGNWNFQDYLARWNTYRSAIVQTTPSAPLTGPCCAAASASGWTVPFVDSLAPGEVTLLTEQYYRANGFAASSTAELLLSADPNLARYLDIVKATSAQHDLPYRLAACNSFYNGGKPGVSDTFASSLWVLDLLFAAAIGGSAGVSMHGGQSTAYTAVTDSNGTVTEVRPEYYGMLLFALAGTGTVVQTSISADGLNVAAYSVKTPSGGLNLVLVNKDTRNLKLAISTGQTLKTATVIEMSAPELSATQGVTIQGSAVGLDGGFSPLSGYQLPVSGEQTSCYLPALSAVLVSLA